MKARTSLDRSILSLFFGLLLTLGPCLTAPRLALAEAPSAPLLLVADSGESYDISRGFRTVVQLQTPYDRTRLSRTGATIVRDMGSAAMVLADEQQLEDLARLGFQPRATDTLSALAPQLGEVTGAGQIGGGTASLCC